MISRRLHFNPNWKSGMAGLLADRLLQILPLILGIILIILGVTLSIPKPSSIRTFSVNPLSTTSSQPITDAPDDPIPVLAYYYIWFDAQSWDRAKKDYPLLGRYSSDDADVMRQHIRWAKQAGIDGFIVSWKSTDKLNRRLSQLIEIANQEKFKLAVIYEGLDFQRNPIPIEQVDADLKYFIDHYADRSVFDLFEKPMVIWSGTWQFSPEEIQSVVQDKRGSIFILASEKNLKGYQRLAKLVDGDAYYWSSVNPDTYSDYPGKLKEVYEDSHPRESMSQEGYSAQGSPGGN
ncbi:MAG TPA: hypothetical protein VK249_19525, partial [Anaerolineales bacterium]|nr:hypothetical protein [Anaerolineales bacterium]